MLLRRRTPQVCQANAVLSVPTERQQEPRGRGAERFLPVVAAVLHGLQRLLEHGTAADRKRKVRKIKRYIVIYIYNTIGL